MLPWKCHWRNKNWTFKNERINNPVIRHGLLMVRRAAGKDDISISFMTESIWLLTLHSTSIPSGKYKGFYLKNCWVIINNTVVYILLRGYSRVHRKPKCDTHRRFCLIFGNIGILTSLSTLILKIIVTKLSSCAKVEFGDFYYDVFVQMRGFLSF